VQSTTTKTPRAGGRSQSVNFYIWTAVVLVAAVLIVVFSWHASGGTTDPTADAHRLGRTTVVIDSAILVFREGLETILVLAAITASFLGANKVYRRPVAVGGSLALAAGIGTWFLVIWFIGQFHGSEYTIQAATGIPALIVLLVVMNWFFHKVYWTGWITMHNRRKRKLVDSASKSQRRIFWGLVVLGFTSVYREGFEVVLFLQTVRLQSGSHIVLQGTLIGLALTSLVGFLTFAMHYKLPYKKMLVLTGIMLGVVLVVMIGESAQEMQLAGWLSTTTININMPDWLNAWFVIYPSVESIAAQVFAIVFVVGSYFIARRVCSSKGNSQGPQGGEQCIVPDCESCELSQVHISPPL
jgi:high-affinity iron transporter